VGSACLGDAICRKSLGHGEVANLSGTLPKPSILSIVLHRYIEHLNALRPDSTYNAVVGYCSLFGALHRLSQLRLN
jgi:hypothetical protein